MMDNLIARVLEENDNFADAKRLVDVEGMSGPRLCNLLNRLVAAMPSDQKYLEIGTWRGLTLLSAAYGNEAKRCVACDKFRVWGRYTGLGLLARAAFRANVERYRGQTATIEFHEMRSLRMFREGLVKGPIGVFFYDGDHSLEGTRDNILAAAPLLANPAVLLVDDWSDPVIRDGTREAITRAGLKVCWERWLGKDDVDRGYWNGLGAFVLGRS